MRVLLLGPTGAEKRAAVTRLVSSYAGSSAPEFIDFEAEYLRPVHEFLDQQFDQQRRAWDEAWSKLLTRVGPPGESDNLIVGLHATITRRLYGCRSPIFVPLVMEYRPDVVVTLVDDVYLMWHRTETRARSLDYRGRPTLQDLLEARRSETFMGDLLASHCRPPARHYLVSIRHPARMLNRLLYHGQAYRIYLGFPISTPRHLLDTGDSRGEDDVNGFLGRMYDFEAQHDNVCLFCPLGIDELPLVKCFERSQVSKGQALVFSIKTMRWDSKQFLGDTQLLMDLSTVPDEVVIPATQVAEARGLIRADVAFRDYRLVRQSDHLIVFNPFYREDFEKAPSLADDICRGVRNEIAMALQKPKPVWIYQDSKHDPNRFADQLWKPEPGSLGEFPRSSYVTIYHCLDEMISKLSLEVQ